MHHLGQLGEHSCLISSVCLLRAWYRPKTKGLPHLRVNWQLKGFGIHGKNQEILYNGWCQCSVVFLGWVWPCDSDGYLTIPNAVACLR